MKKLIALFLALVLALGLMACASSANTETTTQPAETTAPAEETKTEEAAPAEEATEEAAPAAAGSVYWLNFKPESDETLQKVAAMYTEKTGVPVTVVTAASGTYNETLKTVAEDIHARAAELGFDAFTSSSMSSDSSWRFTGHLANLEYYYESVDDPAAWESCPATITGKYMQNYKNLWDLYINNSATNPADLAAGGFDAQAEFAEGKAVFYSQGNWEWSALQEKGMNADDLTMIPYYCGVDGEEKAGLNCGTENCWAVNAEASEEDIQATLDFMYWMVTDADASRLLVDSFGVMPYKQAAESTNPFLKIANEYTEEGNYVMPWVTNFQPNVDAYREALVAAMNQYDADQTDANWELVKTAFVDGWAVQYQAANG